MSELMKTKMKNEDLVKVLNGSRLVRREGYEIVDAYVDRVKRDGIIIVWAPVAPARKVSVKDRIMRFLNSGLKEQQA